MATPLGTLTVTMIVLTQVNYAKCSLQYISAESKASTLYTFVKVLSTCCIHGLAPEQNLCSDQVFGALNVCAN